MANNISDTARIMDGVRIGDDVVIEDGAYIDYDVIIRDHVHIGRDSFIGARSILGEYLADFFDGKTNKPHPLIIGEGALIRSGAILYGGSEIGDHLQTGHRVTIREGSRIGSHVRIGTLSDVQGLCEIGDYVNIHSDVFIAQGSVIRDFVWLFPHVVLTDDPTPPSNHFLGVTVERFACVAACAVLLPGVTIGQDALVGAGAVVTRNVPPRVAVTGNPAKELCDVTKIRNKVTGETVYPWRYTFDRGMPWRDVGFDRWEQLTAEGENLGKGVKLSDGKI